VRIGQFWFFRIHARRALSLRRKGKTIGPRYRERISASRRTCPLALLNSATQICIKLLTESGVAGNAERYRWFVGCRNAPDVDNEPCVYDLDALRRAIAVASALEVASTGYYGDTGKLPKPPAHSSVIGALRNSTGACLRMRCLRTALKPVPRKAIEMRIALLDPRVVKRGRELRRFRKGEVTPPLPSSGRAASILLNSSRRLQANDAQC
jgi:hypothetical protein